MAHPSDLDPDNPTGTRYAQDFCEEHDLDPELWGHINNVALDGYHSGRDEIRPLIKLLLDQAEKESERYYASGLEEAANALKFILIDSDNADVAFQKAVIRGEVHKGWRQS